VSTLYATDGRATFNVFNEIAYDRDGNAIFYISNNDAAISYADRSRSQLFWVSDNWLIAPGGPAYYFDIFEREDEVKQLIADGYLDDNQT
jgi:hypothetical protein